MLIKKLNERNLLFQHNYEEKFPINGIYCGFDATAPSLQIGNLTPIRALKIANDLGIPIFALIGEATTEIGDPSGKNEARKKLDKPQIKSNIENITQQIKKLLPNATLVNNSDWLGKLSLMNFLNEAAVYSSVSTIIKLSTFATRLENNLPLTVQEMLYPLMQGYDFLYLYENFNCNMQFGGQDQWCNVLTGSHLIKKKHAKEDAFALTLNLLTDPAGRKLGKSLQGAIYLDKNMCSEYDFWQFWRNIEDDLVKSCLLRFTDLSTAEIENITNINEAKIILANNLTSYVHSAAAAHACQAKAEAIFAQKDHSQLESVVVESDRLIEIIAELNKCTNSQAKTLINQGAIKIDDTIITDLQRTCKNGSILQIGKKQIFKIAIK